MNKLSRKTIEDVRALGFVRVDGLYYTMGSHNTLIEAAPASRGRWDSNNGMMVFVTLNGQVFTGSMHVLGEKEELFLQLMQKLCPNGKGGVFVPFSNGERASSIPCLMERFADPYPEYVK